MCRQELEHDDTRKIIKTICKTSCCMTWASFFQHRILMFHSETLIRQKWSCGLLRCTICKRLQIRARLKRADRCAMRLANEVHRTRRVARECHWAVKCVTRSTRLYTDHVH